MQTPFSVDPSKPFYFTQQAPEQPKVKRGSWMLPILVTVATAFLMMFAFGQTESPSQSAKSTPTPTPSLTPEPKTEATPPVTPTPTPSASPVTPTESDTPIATPTPSSSSYSQYESQTQPRTDSGLPWNANVKLATATSVLEVHTLPSNGSDIIGILEQGDAVRILTPPTAGEGVMWVNVQKGGYSGWVQSSFLEVRP